MSRLSENVDYAVSSSALTITLGQKKENRTDIIAKMRQRHRERGNTEAKYKSMTCRQDQKKQMAKRGNNNDDRSGHFYSAVSHRQW